MYESAEQKVIQLGPNNGDYHNFMSGFSSSYDSYKEEGWKIKQAIDTGNNRVTLILERVVLYACSLP
jgi:hypothetical protein